MASLCRYMGKCNYHDTVDDGMGHKADRCLEGFPDLMVTMQKNTVRKLGELGEGFVTGVQVPCLLPCLS
jgi:hypothetical protein